MKRIVHCLLSTTIFFCGLSGYSQESDPFKPTLWLSSPQKVNDTLPEFDRLNFHKDLGLTKGTLWGSSKKINKPQHLFLVYKSKKKENLVSFMGEKRAVFLEGKSLYLNDSVNLEGYNESYGELLDVRFSNIQEGRFWMNPQLKDSRVFELVLTDQGSAAATNEIRTYLSIKYGIDLIDHKQYTYGGKQLWDGGNKAYNHHIFGVASMRRFNLYPSKSMHSKDGDLILSLSKGQRQRMDEGSYVLAGSNGKSLTFDKKSKQSRKEWLVQTGEEQIAVDFSIPLSKLGTSEDSFNDYELLVGTSGRNAVKYTGVPKDTLLVFNDVLIKKSNSNIVRLKEHPSDIKFETENNCGQFRLKVKAPSTISNYSVKIYDDKKDEVLASLNVNETYTINNSTSAYFDVNLAYNGKKIVKRFETTIAGLSDEKIEKFYPLENGQATISLKNTGNLSYHWFSNGKEIAQGNEVTLRAAGTYSVKISSDLGCSITQAFSVGEDFNDEGWRIYPNPAAASEDIHVLFNLTEKSDVNIALYDNGGRLVKTTALGTVQNETVNLGKSGLSSGVYIVVAYINDLPQIKKIIIK